jgi:hypothetical protein
MGAPAPSRCWRWLVLGLVMACGGPRVARAQAQDPPAADTTHLVVTRPTVIAWLVVAAGAVDTMPDLEVIADDWSYAMATFGDSLQARGLAFAMATGSYLHLAQPGAKPAIIRLGKLGDGGFVFVRRGMPPCVMRGGFAIEDALAMAGRLLEGARMPDARAGDQCEASAR